MTTNPVLPPKAPIYVTQPFLPPLEEFMPSLRAIWDAKVLTNGGPFHQRLESALAEYLGVRHIALFTNGTLGLLTALQTLRVSGEVITTPYSFAATAHSLLWNGLKPVFADIDPLTLNLDPDQIEAAITPQTTAIMPVHCYGTPCDVDRIQRIADTYGLRVIYDAAHAFGVKHQGDSVLNRGDLSVLSFHATKVFTTVEGGAIVCPDARTKQRIDYLKNFGIADEVTVMAAGINGKMNEIQAAFGLMQLEHVDRFIARRGQIAAHYRRHLSGVKGIRVLDVPAHTVANHSYFPIFVDEQYGLSRDALYERMRSRGVHARRYFYPLLSEMPMYRGLPSAARDRLPNARLAAQQVLCLPIYPALEDLDVQRVIDLIVER
ncbi:dTDP-4-amino-4,6-dideoxygalactose transaminase [Sphaerotilus hippei]|uniref:dTDP-4-amino-4,6-dideoxygalactose transaminase n=1 Tax=Sphaerotilus hippei TaxID=744406 RepID=A0A318GWA3_9BURK|nr:DegT/DnrJ/EryC1/StrS family aminotransferase [Sphaerotilus hippei]PXW93687.1 dTDP-4-amino-4,6-dideoxygalactose transaminase [Sphaerotilus hippei]